MGIWNDPAAAEARAHDQFLMPDLVTPGWVRHLPMRYAVVLMDVAYCATFQLSGAALHKHLKEAEQRLLDEAKRPKTPEELAEIQEREERFAVAYGKPYTETLAGIIALLIDLGLVVRGDVNGEEMLDFPDKLPLVEERLQLPTEEQKFLAQMRANRPLVVAASQIISLLREHRWPQVTASLEQLKSITGQPLAMIRRALQQLQTEGALRLTRPPAKLERTTHFEIIPNWDFIDETYISFDLTVPDK